MSQQFFSFCMYSLCVITTEHKLVKPDTFLHVTSCMCEMSEHRNRFNHSEFGLFETTSIVVIFKNDFFSLQNRNVSPAVKEKPQLHVILCGFSTLSKRIFEVFKLLTRTSALCPSEQQLTFISLFSLLCWWTWETDWQQVRWWRPEGPQCGTSSFRPKCHIKITSFLLLGLSEAFKCQKKEMQSRDVQQSGFFSSFILT